MNIRFQMKNRRRYISEPNSNGPGDFFLVCLLSLICHAVFFISLFFLNDFQFSAPKPKVITVDLVAFAPGASPAAKLHGSEKSSKPLDASAGDNADRVNPDAVSDLSSQPAESAEAEVPTIKPEGGLQSKPDNLKDLIAAREDESPKEEPVVEKESPKEEPVVEKESPKEEPVVEKESPKEELVLKKKKQAEEVKKKLEQDLAKAQKEQAEKKKKQAQAAKKKLEQDLAKAQKESAEKKKKQAQAAKKKLEQDLAKAQKEQAEKLEKENQTQLRKAL
ncbi:MAG: protein TolA, partial [Desulfobacter sp.]